MVIHDLLLNVKEHKFYKKYRKFLEKTYNVKIFLPNDINSPSLADIIFGTVVGGQQNVENVKKFISKKVNKFLKSSDNAKSNDLSVVILSDSEEECASSSESGESICAADKLQSKNSLECTNKTQSPSAQLQDSICIIESAVDSKELPSNDKADPLEDSVYVIECVDDKSPKSKNDTQAVSSSSLEDSICIIENPCSQSNQENMKDGLKNKMARFEKRKNRKFRKKDFKRHKLHDETEIWQNTSFKNSPPAPEFIALHEKNGFGITSSYAKNIPTIDEDKDSDIIILDEPVKPNIKISLPIMKHAMSRHLRPIVIDGSNVARAHGKVTDTFSSKGIKLCIDYFLDRGHTEVTAFVPNYRRHGDRRKFCPTTDQSILEELAKCGKVVFTPSRKVNGQCYASYDDRFIVELASRNGGVIVSNDNFKDLLHENEKFKEAIEKRLLMYCFVGDLFMVPDDPLGRKGPTLNEYLSFPVEHSQNVN